MSQPTAKTVSTTVDIVIPVLNEAHVLEKSVETVRRFLARGFDYSWKLVLVDNGSTDGTDQVDRRTQRVAEKHADVEFLQLQQKGRGRALRYAWLKSQADVVCYMDVDLSTDLEELPKLIRAVAEENYDIAVGSRLMRESRTKRSLIREITSRVYNAVLKLCLATRFSDAQCGFKAVSRQVVSRVVPRVEDESWFFDTELLVLAEKQGYRIKDVPIAWTEDDDSRVRIIATAWDDLRGVFRLRRQLKSGKAALAEAPQAPREDS